MNIEDRLKGLMGSADAEPRASEAEFSEFVRGAHRSLFVRRATAAIGTAALIVLVALTAATFRPEVDTPPIPPARSVSPTQSPEASATPAPTTMEVPVSEQELWFIQGEKLSWGTTATGGTVAAEIAGDLPPDARAAFWLNLLLQGPTGPDREVGATTAIPEGTELLRLMRNGSTYFVDLSSEFESGGGSLSMQLRVAQVVYTATQFERIDSVRIMIEGEMVESIGGEGLIVSEPLTRRDFQDVAPPIVVERPRAGQTFRSGDLVSGFANVFEANVSINIADENGKVLFETFTTATCGSGCWGDFSEAIEFEIDEQQQGRVNVLTYSAEDGSPQDRVSIPVTLVP